MVTWSEATATSSWLACHVQYASVALSNSKMPCPKLGYLYAVRKQAVRGTTTLYRAASKGPTCMVQQMWPHRAVLGCPQSQQVSMAQHGSEASSTPHGPYLKADQSGCEAGQNSPSP